MYKNLRYSCPKRFKRTTYSRLHWHIERDYVHLLLLRQVRPLDWINAAFDFCALFRATRGLLRDTDGGLLALEHQFDRGVFHQHVQHGNDPYICHVAAL